MPPPPMPPPSVADTALLEMQEGNIHVHAGHGGSYTDASTPVEQDIAQQMRGRAWQDVVRERFAEARPWLFDIITSPTRRRLLDVLPITTGMRVLDVGSGWGQVSLPLGRQCEVHALDQTASRLCILREMAAQEQVTLTYHCGNILTYPFMPACFDLIILNGVLEYTGRGQPGASRDAHVRVLNRLRTLLRAGGTIYIGIENALGLKYLMGAPDDHTGRHYSTFRDANDHDEEPRTWALNGYEQLFAQAQLRARHVYACFPDYKLIAHMVDIQAVDAFLLQHGLPAPEHSGVDGTLLPTNDSMGSAYRRLAELGISRFFVPSYGFVLERQSAAAGGPPPRPNGPVALLRKAIKGMYFLLTDRRKFAERWKRIAATRK